VNSNELDPLARLLVGSYLETPVYSRWFSEQFGQPPTLAAKVHNWRSIAQAKVNSDLNWELSEEYSEYGKLQVTDSVTGRCYLVRSDGAVAIERAFWQGTLFDTKVYIASSVVMLVYRFHSDGLDLLVTGTIRHRNKKRLEAEGKPIYVGTWPFFSDSSPPFGQGQEDPFSEVGGLEDFDEIEGGEGEE
jgi:hypothetical protein